MLFFPYLLCSAYPWRGLSFASVVIYVFLLLFYSLELLPSIVIIDVCISPVSKDARAPICTIVCFEVLDCSLWRNTLPKKQKLNN